MATPALPNVIPEPTVRLLLNDAVSPDNVLIVGDVRVLFVSVSVVVLPINVSAVSYTHLTLPTTPYV